MKKREGRRGREEEGGKNREGRESEERGKKRE